jgi:hypothetical protein
MSAFNIDMQTNTGEKIFPTVRLQDGGRFVTLKFQIKNEDRELSHSVTLYFKTLEEIIELAMQIRLQALDLDPQGLLTKAQSDAESPIPEVLLQDLTMGTQNKKSCACGIQGTCKHTV